MEHITMKKDFPSTTFSRMKKSGAGFTILEVMIAIFVLTIAVGASYSLIQKTFIAISLTQSKLIASYFAQEGVENVRNARDTNWLNSAPNWTDGITGGGPEYIYFLDGNKSKFEKTTSIAVNGDVMEIKVDVEWNERGRDYSVEVINYLYDWYSRPEQETCEEWCVANYPTYTEAFCNFLGPIICGENQATGEQFDCDVGQVCFCCYQ